MTRDSSVSAGISESCFRLFCLVFPLVKRQIKLSKEPNSCWTFRKAWALVIAAAILALFLMTPSVFMRRSMSFWLYFATFSGLKSSNACRSFSRR